MTTKEEISALNSIDKTVSDALSELEELVNNRTDYFDGKSEKWQEDEKGQEYETRTGQLSDIVSLLTDAQAEIQGLIA